MNFKMKPNYVLWTVSLVGGLLAGIFAYSLLSSPLPPTTGVENNQDILKSLIGWGLSRQTTHAALELSAVVGLFSMLRLRPNVLARKETKVAFFGFLVFLSYEYFKLIRSFQLVNQWEELLSKNFFQSDPLQSLFFPTTSSLLQALFISVLVFLLIRMYAYASTDQTKSS